MKKVRGQKRGLMKPKLNLKDKIEKSEKPLLLED